MASKRVSDPSGKQSRSRPATTPEGRENQLISMAIDEAERQIKAGEASAQVITHFLKLGSSREQLEQKRLEAEVRLQEARIKSLADAARIETLYAEAITAMRNYGGGGNLPTTSEPED